MIQGLVLLCLLAVGAAQAYPLIDEIMPDPSAVPDRQGEWFELYNPGPLPVDLDGWVLRDLDNDRHVIRGPLVILPGEAVVLAREGGPAINGGLTPDYVYGADLILANGADELLLVDPGGTVVDQVIYDTSFPFARGVSMVLADPALDNALAGSWRAATAFYNGVDRGTPGSTPFAPAVLRAPAPLPVPAPPPWLLAAAALLPLARRRRDCGLIPHHDAPPAPVHRPALHPRQTPQPLHFLHHPHLHAGHRRGGDRPHHRPLGDERIRDGAA